MCYLWRGGLCLQWCEQAFVKKNTLHKIHNISKGWSENQNCIFYHIDVLVSCRTTSWLVAWTRGSPTWRTCARSARRGYRAEALTTGTTTATECPTKTGQWLGGGGSHLKILKTSRINRLTLILKTSKEKKTKPWQPYWIAVTWAGRKGWSFVGDLKHFSQTSDLACEKETLFSGPESSPATDHRRESNPSHPTQEAGTKWNWVLGGPDLL